MIVWLKAFGFNLLGEVSTNLGRIDAVWICPEITVVVEVKAKPSDDDVPKLLNDAIAQIRNKRYYEQFVDEQRKVVIMGIVFAGNEVGCTMEAI
jgi:Holliday junction resolvase-like predicted endonuclease